MDEPVPVTTVRDKLEADMVCDLLRSAGLECGFRLGQTAVSDSAFGQLPPSSDGYRSSCTRPTSRPRARSSPPSTPPSGPTAECRAISVHPHGFRHSHAARLACVASLDVEALRERRGKQELLDFGRLALDDLLGQVENRSESGSRRAAGASGGAMAMSRPQRDPP